MATCSIPRPCARGFVARKEKLHFRNSNSMTCVQGGVQDNRYPDSSSLRSPARYKRSSSYHLRGELGTEQAQCSPPQQNAHAPWAPPSPRGRHRLLVCCCPSASTHRCRKRTRQHQKARHHSCGSLKFFTLTGLHPERYRTADNDSARCSIDSMQAALHATHANTQRPRSRLSD